MYIKLLKVINIICIVLFIASVVAVISAYFFSLAPDLPLLLSFLVVTSILLLADYLGVEYFFCKDVDVCIRSYLMDIKRQLTDKIVLLIDQNNESLIVCKNIENKTIITINNVLLLPKIIFIIKRYRLFLKTSLAVLYKDDFVSTAQTDTKLLSLIERMQKINFYYNWSVPIYILMPLDKQEKECCYCTKSDLIQISLPQILVNFKNPGRIVNNLMAFQEYKSNDVYFLFFSQHQNEDLISKNWLNYISSNLFLTLKPKREAQKQQIDLKLINKISFFEISNRLNQILSMSSKLFFAIGVFLIFSLILVKNNCITLNNAIMSDLTNFYVAQNKEDKNKLKSYIEHLKKDLILLNKFEQQGVDIQYIFGFYDADRFLVSLKEAIASYHEDTEQIKQNLTIDSTSLFASGKYEISQKEVSELINSLYVIRSCSKCDIVIIGHTDNLGNPRSNYELSEKRALAVKQWLIDYGKVVPERIMVKGLGDSRPISDNSTEEGRKKNRRVEIILVPPSDNQ